MTRDLSNRKMTGSSRIIEEDGAARTIETSRLFRWAYDSGDTTLFYYGQANAQLGVLDSEAAWQIAKVDFTNGTIKWADYGLFTQIWDDRESLTYG